MTSATGAFLLKKDFAFELQISQHQDIEKEQISLETGEQGGGDIITLPISVSEEKKSGDALYFGGILE